MLSYLPDVAGASRTAGSADAGAPAGTVVVRAGDLHDRGGTVVPAGAVPSAGELAVFCRPVVVVAPAVVRRDGRVLEGGWLPDQAGALCAHGAPPADARANLSSHDLIVNRAFITILMV